MIKNKNDLLLIKYTQLIKDPFPEYTQYEMLLHSLTSLQKFFGTYELRNPPKSISIHEAYQKGYNQAYNEILAKLPEE